jgi:hypothetical protein
MDRLVVGLPGLRNGRSLAAKEGEQLGLLAAYPLH